jgi:hypothetical protein
MEVSGQLHAPAALPPGKESPGIHWIGGWVGPRAGLDATEKREALHCRKSNPGPSLYQLSYPDFNHRQKDNIKSDPRDVGTALDKVAGVL